MTLLHDEPLERLLAALHTRNAEQLRAMQDRAARRTRGTAPDPDAEKRYLSDKLVALDPDKAAFCYQLIRAKDARRVVEIGTGYGVSTLYLAAAVRDNVRTSGGTGLVTGTEYEPGKAAAAREHFATAGLAAYVDLRVGDLRETLRAFDAPVDLVLVDIWIRMARPALELLHPHLRRGAVVLCDNTAQYRGEYADYFDFINAPAHSFTTITLPFSGGLELSVRCG